jgi:hypothetical protein
VVDPRTAEVAVRAHCDGNQVRAFVVNERATSEHFSHVRAHNGEPLEVQRDRYLLPSGPASISYHVHIDAIARDAQDIDVAFRSGDAWVVAVSTFLMQPHPVAADTMATVSLTLPSGTEFATALAPSPQGYQLRARELGYATYAVFGRFHRQRLTLPGPLSLPDADYSAPSSVALDARELGERDALDKGHGVRRDGLAPDAAAPVTAPEPRPVNGGSAAEIEVVTLPGELAVDAATRMRWLRDAARAVATFWHGFPTERTLVIFIPTPRHRGIAHGKVVAAGGAGVAIHLGSRTTERHLYRDWILVHELFHLGVPSFAGEGKWLDEGLATYYEPIIRARAGWRSHDAVWQEFADDMPQGLEAVEGHGVEQPRSYRDIYWGGAILSLLADVKTRARSGGRMGLEDGLRAVLARGGNATSVWPLERVIEVVDGALGAPTLRPLADAHGYRGEPVDLDGLLGSLGVRRARGGILLDDNAALAPIRRSILVPTLDGGAGR